MSVSTPRRPRPKLSLQTNSLSLSFGRPPLALLSAASSPTTTNTFANAHHPHFVHHQHHQHPQFPSHYHGQLHAPASPEPRPPPPPRRQPSDVLPYHLPRGMRSILRNSPWRRSTSASSSRRRELFPAEKRVRYRAPLDEEVHNVQFIARHSDLLSESPPESSNESNLSLSAALSDDNDDDDDEDDDNEYNDGDNTPSSPASLSPSPDKPTSGKRKCLSERQIRAAAEPGLHTPPAPRSEKAVHWRWTLGPVSNMEPTPSARLTAYDGKLL